MIHYKQPITNTKGDALIGYYVKLADTSDNSTITLYADASLTPIVSVSGIDDTALVDSDGMADFWVPSGTYHMDIYATDATSLIRRETDMQFGVPDGDYGDVSVLSDAWTVQSISGDTTLTALAAFNTNGILTQTATDTFVARTLTGTANEITVTNGDGVAGAPTLSLPTSLIFTGKTITGGSITPAATPTTTAAGYLGCPQNIQDATYTTVMSDAGKHLYHTSASAHTWTIDSNANVAYPIGTILTFINASTGGNVTIAITTDTLRWGSSTGSRTLAANGVATVIKVTSTTWRMTGDGIT